MNRKIPAVSIVIPMYNAEKYIGDCLDSILAQTFQDYEVIVVDDCSTDNSRAVVQSYLPKFDGGGVKLNLICSDKNSGGCPGVPRNIGIRVSRGEYIQFIDSDDAITPTALEELYPIAKKFDADVVYCEKYYEFSIGEKFSINKNLLKVSIGSQNLKDYELVTKPALISDDPIERLKSFAEYKFLLGPVNYFIRRRFISTHDIKFPKLRYGEDNFWNLFLICKSKNFVRIPNPVYVCRVRADSTSRTPSIDLMIRRCSDHLFQGISIISQFADEFTILKEHPEIQYSLFNFISNNEIHRIFPLYAQIPFNKINELIIRELAKVDNKTEITSFLFNRMNIFNINLIQQQQIIRQQQAQIRQLQAQLQSKQ